MSTNADHWVALVATPAPTPSTPDSDKKAASNGGALFLALGVGLLLIGWALRKRTH